MKVWVALGFGLMVAVASPSDVHASQYRRLKLRDQVQLVSYDPATGLAVVVGVVRSSSGGFEVVMTQEDVRAGREVRTSRFSNALGFSMGERSPSGRWFVISVQGHGTFLVDHRDLSSTRLSMPEIPDTWRSGYSFWGFVTDDLISLRFQFEDSVWRNAFILIDRARQQEIYRSEIPGSLLAQVDSADGKRLLRYFDSSYGWKKECVARLYERESDTYELRIEKKTVCGAATLSPDGSALFLSTGPRTLGRFDASTGAPLGELNLAGEAHDARISSDGLRILVSLRSGARQVVDLDSGRPTFSFKAPQVGELFAFSPDLRYAAHYYAEHTLGNDYFPVSLKIWNTLENRVDSVLPVDPSDMGDGMTFIDGGALATPGEPNVLWIPQARRGG